MAQTIGHGFVLAYADAGTSTSYTTIADVKSITMPSMEVTDVDITNLDSANYTKEFTAGLIDPGEISFTVSYDESQSNTLYGLLRQSKKFRVTATDSATYAVAGYVKTFGFPQVESESELTNEMVIKVNGAPTVTTN
jgi:hypothetical protein